MIYALAALVVCCVLFPAAAAWWAYRVGVRDGLEEKTWLEELPPVELAEPNLIALDTENDTVDKLIYLARMEEI